MADAGPEHLVSLPRTTDLCAAMAGDARPWFNKPSGARMSYKVLGANPLVEDHAPQSGISLAHGKNLLLHVELREVSPADPGIGQHELEAGDH